ncbi:sigma-70 family RNA polymerase sigma factor [Streptomyces sp. CNS654]|uniref:sigma-70 family RNA polymerase sigma factor n=1 Tax=Streptomyces sp. CNS654 TaxID=1506995 RepID=UPI000A63AC12|nr:sigma-70 family RNA polymerase sigma factor [Streptomyces sp. CNS654]
MRRASGRAPRFTLHQVLLTENPAAYAWTAMRNKVVDHARARTRRPPLIDEAAFNTVALRDAVDPIGQITESLALFRALRRLREILGPDRTMEGQR